MKTNPDEKRLAKYQSVINILQMHNAFSKADIYKLINHEKAAFVGKVIHALVNEGYLISSGIKTKPIYSWSEKKKVFKSDQWIEQRVFSPAVSRSPCIERPRERLLRFSPAKLRTAELLAILIRSGLQGESAMQAGEKLLIRFGGDLEKLSLQTKNEVKRISRAIGTAGYCQIMAGLELGKRLALQRSSGATPYHKIKNTTDALHYCKQHFINLIREATQEEFHVILLDDKHNVIKSEQVTVGLINKNLVHPREVFKSAIRESASALILVHNHPNDDPTPSEDDKTITKELIMAAETLGLRILDHIILSRDKVLSMVDEKIV